MLFQRNSVGPILSTDASLQQRSHSKKIHVEGHMTYYGPLFHLQASKMRRLRRVLLVGLLMISSCVICLIFSAARRQDPYSNIIEVLLGYGENYAETKRIYYGNGSDFLDLTFEFEQKSMSATYSYNVLEAIKDAGYTVTLVSVSKINATPNTTTQDAHSMTRTRERPSDVSSSSMVKEATNEAPNVVHYVFWGADLTFTFVNYLSYRSVDRFIKPDQIFVHGDRIPTGVWWNRLVKEVNKIYHVHRVFTKFAPNGKRYQFRAHISDYFRTETLLRFGGIYLDADVIAVKSFTPLRQYPVVMGLETDNGLCNGIIIARRGAPFLKLLLEQYHSYLGKKERWELKSVLNTFKLAELYPHLIHVEKKSLNRPNWEELEKIHSELYDLSQNYAVHLWVRVWPKELRPHGMADILKKNTTFGRLGRMAVFGSPDIRN